MKNKSMAGTYKVKRISKILESMTATERSTKPAPVITPTKPIVKPFNPATPPRPSTDPGPKNYQEEINKVVAKYNGLIKKGLKPVKNN